LVVASHQDLEQGTLAIDDPPHHFFIAETSVRRIDENF
jgi:hypothetical protein